MKLFLLVVGVFCSQVFSVEYLSKDWPKKTKCETCFPIKLDLVTLNAPSNEIKAINSLYVGRGAFTIRADRWLNTESHITFMIISEDNITGGLNKKYSQLGVKNLSSFFKLLHNEQATGKLVNISKKIMGVSGSSQFIAYHSDKATAYWVDSEATDSTLYILFKGNEDEGVLIAGHLTESNIGKILSSIELVGFG